MPLALRPLVQQQLHRLFLARLACPEQRAAAMTVCQVDEALAGGLQQQLQDLHVATSRVNTLPTITVALRWLKLLARSQARLILVSPVTR